MARYVPGFGPRGSCKIAFVECIAARLAGEKEE